MFCFVFVCFFNLIFLSNWHIPFLSVLYLPSLFLVFYSHRLIEITTYLYVSQTWTCFFNLPPSGPVCASARSNLVNKNKMIQFSPIYSWYDDALSFISALYCDYPHASWWWSSGYGRHRFRFICLGTYFGLLNIKSSTDVIIAHVMLDSVWLMMWI